MADDGRAAHEAAQKIKLIIVDNDISEAAGKLSINRCLFSELECRLDAVKDHHPS